MWKVLYLSVSFYSHFLKLIRIQRSCSHITYLLNQPPLNVIIHLLHIKFLRQLSLSSLELSQVLTFFILKLMKLDQYYFLNQLEENLVEIYVLLKVFSVFFLFHISIPPTSVYKPRF